MLQVYLQNAFNLVSRRVILRETRRHLPEIEPWVKLCYRSRQDPKLWSGTFTFDSHTGIQQGDPPGPLLFALALNPAVKELRDRIRIETSTIDAST